MSDEQPQKPQEILLVENPDHPNYSPTILTGDQYVRHIQVEDSESWAEYPVRIGLTTTDVRGSTSEAMRLTDQEAFQLMGKIATHLLKKGFLRVEKGEQD